MTVVKAQKLPAKKGPSADEILARFCLTFPQYKLQEARKLPYKRIAQMLKVARKVEAEKMYELMQIIAAPHTKKQKGVKNVLEYYKGIMEGKDG